MDTFKHELRDLINRHSMENGSDTPDHILAAYLAACLAAFDAAVQQRKHATGRELKRKHPKSI